MFKGAAQTKQLDDNTIGSSEQNTVFMGDGKTKTLLMTILPNLAHKSSTSWLAVAHVGTTIKMEKYAPDAPKLTFAKSGIKKKGVPPIFDSINGMLIEIAGTTVCTNSSSDKSARFPLREEDRSKKGTAIDLNVMRGVTTRNKYGNSGQTWNFVTSQRDGLNVELTEFLYVKDAEGYDVGFGLSGSNTNYVLDLAPDTKLQRTNVRIKLQTTPMLRRALTITADLLQIKLLWGPEKIDPDLLCDPATLYADLKAMGYNWDELLDTREYWLYDQYSKKEKPFLSTIDLLRMRKGLYKPYWMK